MEFFAGVGLIQGDSVGVKSCPVELGLISAVKGIAEQRALQGCHVEADLVGSAGFSRWRAKHWFALPVQRGL